MWCQVLYQKTVHHSYHAYTGWHSWITVVEHARHKYQCLPVVSARLLKPHYNVTSHTETTGNWNLQHKTSVGSTRSSLSFVLGMSDVSTHSRLCLSFWNTPEITSIVAIYGEISQSQLQN